MTSAAAEARYGGARRPHGPNLVLLWVIVSGLWTVATCLRISRVWVPGVGWPPVLSGTFTWVSLLLPPLVFAIVLWLIGRPGTRFGVRPWSHGQRIDDAEGPPA